MSIARFYFRGAGVRRLGYSGPFRGNPNTAISGIAGDIVLSRTSGETPAFVQASISGITATGTDYPFRDLEASWDFGDPGSTNTLTNPVTGATVNTNSDQVAPEAVHCYRTASGTPYTITCTLRWWDGSGYSSTQKTATFTASAFSGTNEFWFDSAAAGGGNGSESTPFNDFATLRTKSNLGGANLHLKYGSTFTSPGGGNSWIVGQDHARIDAYGNPADGRPIIDGNNIASGHGTIWFTTEFNAVNDSVYSNIRFAAGGTNSHGVRFTDAPSYTNQCTNVYFDNCSFDFCQTDVGEGHGFNGSDAYDAFNRHGFYRCESIQAIGEVGQANVWFLGTATNWWFMFGCTVKCTTAKVWNDLLDHWIYPGINYHGIYKWCEFGPGNTCFAINGNHHGNADEHFKWHLIGENKMHGTAGAIELNVSNANDSGRYDDTVIEGNLIYNHDTDNAVSVVMCYGLTVRDNYVAHHSGNHFVSIGSPASQGEIAYDVYRNNVYSVGAGCVNTGNGITLRTQITDNVFWNTSASALGILLDSTDTAWGVSGSIVDRNQYYIPNDSSTPDTYNSTNSGSGVISFASWQAAGFDVNGSELAQAPDWPDPANGDFGQ